MSVRLSHAGTVSKRLNIFRPITRYISETVEDRWVHAVRRLTSIEFSFDPCNIFPIVPGAYTGEAKMCKNVLKWPTFRLQACITGKRLKIHGYILRGVLQALNPISNRVTFTAIVPGATPYGGVKFKGARKKLRFPTNISL